MPRPPRPGPDDIVLGEHIANDSGYLFRRRPVLVHLTLQDQAYHAILFGRTGLGKSRLLHGMFVQHHLKGHGICLIDPHGDLSLGIMAQLTERSYFSSAHAFDRLVYIDWGNGSFVPFNVLAAYNDPKRAALSVLDAMLRAWPELRRAASFQTLTLAGVHVLHQNEQPLTRFHDLITDPAFRARCLEHVQDPLIHQTFGAMRFNNQESGSARRRAFALAFDDFTALTLGAPDCVLTMRRFMDEGISLILNLGNVPDDETRSLLGALLLVQIEHAARSRRDLSERARRRWIVLIDEWPSFSRSDNTVASILAQMRKFGLALALSAQGPGQIESEALQAALENCRLQVIFGLGRKGAVDEARELAYLDPAIPAHTQFEILAQDIQHLAPQECYVKLHNDPPRKIRTLDVPDAHPGAAELAAVLETYRKRYQRTRAEAEAACQRITDRLQPTAQPAQPFALFSEADSPDEELPGVD